MRGVVLPWGGKTFISTHEANIQNHHHNHTKEIEKETVFTTQSVHCSDISCHQYSFGSDNSSLTMPTVCDNISNYNSTQGYKHNT
jgi:hypothetical protein